MGKIVSIKIICLICLFLFMNNILSYENPVVSSDQNKTDYFQELVLKIGSKNIISDKTKLEKYKSDYYKEFTKIPTLAVTPENDEQIKAILEIANKYKIPIIVRGAGTSTTGAVTPVEDGTIIVLTKKLNKILEIDKENYIAVVEPGVVLRDLQKSVEKQGLFYPPDPNSLSVCTIGGNIAQNAAGPRTIKYGVTRDYILGLEGYWANGNKFVLGGKIRKGRYGYDLMQLLIGSEGTLGIITKIYLKLLVKPKYTRCALLEFNNYKDAIQALNDILKSDIEPAACEFLNKDCFIAGNKHIKLKTDKNAYILLELNSSYLSDLNTNFKKIHHIVIENHGTIKEPKNKQESDQIWAIRRDLGIILGKHEYITQDIVIPRNKIPEYMEFLEKLDASTKVKIFGFGHLGDGNIHVFIDKSGVSDEIWQSKKYALELKVIQKAIKLGGTITAEHGFGLSKKNYLPLIYDQQHIDYFRRIKQIFDPNNILNPDKIF